ncbi:hypothetical protein WRSd3_02995 [Shigella dysenteriae WRSd3]|uniref:Uncharacterized protein n=1 Tax=Shigella dysenteriae WRSd3 TaxID=1401327 RepID=A0A090NWS7_SHIDY|nr:hypothetical protein WRSd3_02995 [Shigella dysenteriae WRSd3]
MWGGFRLELSSPGYFICHFGPGQCSKSSRTMCTLRFLRAVRVQTDCNNYAC